MLQGGFVGVDVFFVISGFLISNVIFKGLSNGSFSFLQFYSRRIRRIFPALLLVCVFLYIFAWIFLLPIEFEQVGKHIGAGVAFISNFVLWSESGYFDADALSKPLLHLWSLGIEEQFYLFFPVFLYWLWEERLPFFGMILGLACFSFYLSIALSQSDPVAGFYSPIPRIWELMAGAMLAYVSLQPKENVVESGIQNKIISLIENNSKILNANMASMAGLVLVLVSLFMISEEDAFPGYLALLPVSGSILMLAAGREPQGMLILLVIIGGLIGGAVAIFLQKAVIILGTAFGGAMDVVTGIIFFMTGHSVERLIDDPQLLGGHLHVALLGWLLLGIAGALAQRRASRRIVQV